MQTRPRLKANRGLSQKRRGVLAFVSFCAGRPVPGHHEVRVFWPPNYNAVADSARLPRLERSNADPQAELDMASAPGLRNPTKSKSHLFEVLGPLVAHELCSLGLEQTKSYKVSILAGQAEQGGQGNDIIICQARFFQASYT